MITFANAELLAEYLRRAEHAHKVSGAPDKGWPDWYANWISKAAAPVRLRYTTFLPGDIAPTVQS